jgi:hypothetical protein
LSGTTRRLALQNTRCTLIRWKPAKNFFDALDIGPWSEPPAARLTVPPSEFFDEYVARGQTVPSSTFQGRHTQHRHKAARIRSAFLRAIALVQASRQSRAPTLSTDPGPPAGSVCTCHEARPSSGVYYLLLHELLVPSHSPPLFVGNPRRCIFDPSRS